MDTLKKNGFTISLVVLGLGAVGLLYFLVIGKIFGEWSAAREGLARVEKQWGVYADRKKTPVVPSEKKKQVDEEAAKRWDDQLAAAQQYYEARGDKFRERHEDWVTMDDPAGFKASFQTKVAELRKNYQSAFLKPAEAPPAPGAEPSPGVGGQPAPAAGAEGQPAPAVALIAAQTPPAPAIQPSAPAGRDKDVKDVPVVRIYPNFRSIDDINRAMKEFWILDEVFRAATELKLGGLQEIRFPDRPAIPEPSPPKENRWIKARVNIDMPLVQLDAFLQKLFQSEHVPFRVESLLVTRPPESVLLKMVESKTYKEEAEAEKETPDALRPEPPVSVDLVLSALDYAPPAATAAAAVPAPAAPEREK